MRTVHLVGTGAGVPFIYFVGKAIQHKNIPIPGRITAIDAGPGFEYPEWTKDFKSLADYTEAMHTSVSYNGDNRPGRYVSHFTITLKSISGISKYNVNWCILSIICFLLFI